eukprot:TRINITY_DN828_c0_g1_i1.p2 TRINITY_DN828_c0_g1~~TRINITY_DN828_c0_g1_i1.p2  ORF type:complete len:938 (+),score=235.37 TRINITY_DN828_c0_g1_i1:6725-9538(+)
MHRVYWVLFTVLCACVVSVPSSHRFTTRKGHIKRALSKLRASKRNVAFGASHHNQPSTSGKSKESSPDGELMAIYEDGSENFMNPHYLQDKFETLTDTDQHFIDYSGEESYDTLETSKSEHEKSRDVYYEDGFDTNPEVVDVVGQSTESEQMLYDDDENDEYDEEEDGMNADLDEVRTFDQSTDSQQSLDDENGESGDDEFDYYPNHIHVAGQSADSDQAVDEFEYDEDDADDDGSDSDPDDVQFTGLSTELEQPLGHDDDEFDEQEDVLDSDSVHVLGQLDEFEEFLGDEDDEDDGEEGGLDSDSIHIFDQPDEAEDLIEDEFYENDEEDTGIDSDSVHVAGQSAASEVLLEDEPFEEEGVLESDSIHALDHSDESEDLLEDESDEYDEEEGDVDSHRVQIVGQSAEFESHTEDENDENDEEEDLNSDLGIHINGQSTESEQVNETEHNLYEDSVYEDEEADHESIDDEMEYDEEGLEESLDMMVQGQALLLGDSEPDHPESSEVLGDDNDDEWTAEELYEPLDDVAALHYQTDDIDEESSDEDLTVDGMSYEYESHSRKDYVDEDEAVLGDYDDDLDDSVLSDTEDLDPVGHEYELTEDQREGQKSAMAYNFDEDVEAFDQELESLIRQDQVNGQSALQANRPSFSFSADRRESDFEYGEQDEFDEHSDYEDEDHELDREVGTSRTAFVTNSDNYDHELFGDDDVFLDEDDDSEEDDQDYIGHQNLRTSKSDLTNSEQFMDDAEDDELDFDVVRLSNSAQHGYSEVYQEYDEDDDTHVDGYAVVHEDLVNNDLRSLDESPLEHTEDNFQGSRDTIERDIIHGETGYEEVVMEDEVDDEEGNQWPSRQDSNYLEAEDRQESANDDWDEYLLDLHSAQRVRTRDIGKHELSDSVTAHWSDTETTPYSEGGRSDLEEQLEINSHSHGMLRDPMKSILV